MKKLTILLLLIAPSSLAQQNETYQWFPYKTGDMWEYYVTDGVISDTAQIINVKDSVGADGKICLTQYRRFINPNVHDPYLDSLRHTIDTSKAEVFQPFGEPTDPPRATEILIYKFNAQSRDQWVMYDYSAVGGEGFIYEMARVREKYEGSLFGINTMFIQMDYYLAEDSTDTTGLGRQGILLAKGFGLIQSIPAEGGYHYYLKGAVIDNILYGDTTSVVTAVYNPPYKGSKDFELYQNYPNPFNPLTTIKFSLSSRTFMKLVVYDLLGREVARLYEGIKEAGTHTVIFEATDSQSGVYYYRLSTGDYTITQKMILLK